MTTARFLVGDVFDRLAEIPDGSVDFLVTSPPFLALRSYLPEGHPDKGKEIGSEPTPAAFIDVMLELTAEWGRVLAPHGSIAVELGDTYAGSGGAGGDYNNAGLRDGQPAFDGSGSRNRAIDRAATYDGGASDRHDFAKPGTRSRLAAGEGWPLAKSLACIPQLYQVALAYGINPLTGAPSPAGRWRVRNLKPWIRSNPPVGALGDKERPATSYVIVACRATDRYFDLDAVRTGHSEPGARRQHGSRRSPGGGGDADWAADATGQNAGGAPPRDWWHHVDATLDAELAERAGKFNGGENPAGSDMGHRGRLGSGDGTNNDGKGRVSEGIRSVGAQGVHLRRALERAGILTTLEALDVSPRGYSGAHYAVWPPELVRLLINEMCPTRVCTECGQPSRRITEATYVNPHTGGKPSVLMKDRKSAGVNQWNGTGDQTVSRVATTVGWSDCGHDTWRPGTVLDPFAGSGTTLAVATGMGREAVGIDIDERNAHLAVERCGMFLEIHDPPRPALDTKAL